MHVELSTDQRQAINTAGTPLEVVDSLTGNVYVLLPQESFARVQSLVSEELAETLPAQIETAMRAGWDDPAMDEYNHYDQHRSP